MTATGKRIALPPLSQHLREFAARRDAWFSLARNLVPVVGVYALGWSVALTIFTYWFDGVAALVAFLAEGLSRDMRTSCSKARSWAARLGLIVTRPLSWILVLGIVGVPYWFSLIALQELFENTDLGAQLTHSPALWLTFGMMMAMHFSNAFHVGYDNMTAADREKRGDWEAHILLLRGIVMFALAEGFLAIFLVPLMAMTLTYIEVWPERAFGLVFGAPRQRKEQDSGES